MFIEIAIVVALTLFNGVLAMSELALVSSRKERLSGLAGNGNKGAKVALKLIDDPGAFLSTVQIGITLVGVVAGAFSGATLGARLGLWLDSFPLLDPYGRTIGVGLVVLAITYLSLVIGELVPKRIALHHPERVASLIAPPMRLLSRFALPAVWLLRHSTDAVLRLFGLRPSDEPSISEDEVKALVAEGTRIGTFAPQERAMIEGVLRLADRPVRAIMTPRPDVRWLEPNADAEAIRTALAVEGHSRYPVARGSADHISGVVTTGALLERSLSGQAPDVDAVAQRPLVVHDRLPVLRLLDLFRRERVHFAVVVDEFGASEGIVTATDVLEAIAGDLPERDDEDEPLLVSRGPGSWLVDGGMSIDAFEHDVGLTGISTSGDYHTVAGFVLHEMGRVPTVGERFEREGVSFEVVDMDGRRIDRVLVEMPQQAPNDSP